MDDARQAKAQPRYQDVADTLISEVTQGKFPVGSMLPTELELCERFDVSRYTIREALRRMGDMGLVARRQGSGTVVQSTDPGTGFMQSLDSLSELLQYPPGTRIDLQEASEIVAGRNTARLLRARIGQKFFRISGVRLVDATGQSFCWSDIYLRPEYSGVADVIGDRTRPAYALVEELYGQKVHHVSVEMFASSVSERHAKALGVEPGTPAMTIIRRYAGEDDRVFEVSVGVHPEGRFTYSAVIQRDLRCPATPS